MNKGTGDNISVNIINQKQINTPKEVNMKVQKKARNGGEASLDNVVQKNQNQEFLGKLRDKDTKKNFLD